MLSNVLGVHPTPVHVPRGTSVPILFLEELQHPNSAPPGTSVLTVSADKKKMNLYSFFLKELVPRKKLIFDSSIYTYGDLKSKIDLADLYLSKFKKKENIFNARYSAKKRTYKYTILNRNSPSPLNKNRAWFIKKKLDINLIKKSLKILKGTHDFSTFRASSCQAKSAIRTLDSAILKKRGQIIEITFSSKSFLQQQVRSMVGAIKYVGEKKWTLKQFKSNFKSKKRINCAPPAPACGLYLKKIKY